MHGEGDGGRNGSRGAGKKEANATPAETKGDATRTDSRKSRDLFICSKVNGASRLKGCIIYLTCMRAFGKRMQWRERDGEEVAQTHQKNCGATCCNVSLSQLHSSQFKVVKSYSVLAAYGLFQILNLRLKQKFQSVKRR